LRNSDSVARAFTHDIDQVQQVYLLAADMGGMGYIKGNDAIIVENNLRINLNCLQFLRGFKHITTLYTSSACVYPVHKQESTMLRPLKEYDAYPANPEDGYGWEKLMTERICGYYHNDFGMDVRIARFHNIFGPLGTYTGGREKAPAAMCRKVAYAKLTNTPYIEVWGDGHQTRSFCYIDDCVTGLQKLMASGYTEPLNIGSDRMVSINFLARLAMAAAGYECEIRHVEGPQGVRGRNSDNSLLRKVLGWEPQVSLEDGMKMTYKWVEAQVAAEQLKNA
jgi:GDP-D-mannose 3',5'-epimerase